MKVFDGESQYKISVSGVLDNVYSYDLSKARDNEGYQTEEYFFTGTITIKRISDNEVEDSKMFSFESERFRTKKSLEDYLRSILKEKSVEDIVDSIAELYKGNKRTICIGKIKDKRLEYTF